MNIKRNRKSVLVVSAVVSAMMLSACGPTAPPPPIEKPSSFAWDNFSGQEINLLLSQHPLQEAIAKKIPEFEELTGIKVNAQALTEDEYFTKLQTELQSGSGSYDVFMTGPSIWQYVDAGWIEPLDDWIEDATYTGDEWGSIDDFYPATTAFARWDGTPFGGGGEGPLYALPSTEEGVVLHYRKDILEANGIEVPDTIDELIDAAAKLDGTEFEGKKISGYVSVGDKVWPSLQQWSTFIYGYGGSDIDNGELAVNSPETVKGIEKLDELMQYTATGGSAFSWYEAQNVYRAGNAAFYLDADLMAPALQEEGSAVRGKTAVALPPAGPAGRYSGMWVWSLAMNSASNVKPAAWTFLQWATSPEFEEGAIADGVVNPPRKSVREGAVMGDFVADWGNYNEISMALLQDGVAVWPYAPSRNWNQFGDTWATSIQSVLTGQGDPQSAMDKVADKLQPLLEAD